jgi:hypothetical protein
MAGTGRRSGFLEIHELRVDSLYSAFILEADGPVFDECKLFEYGLSQTVCNSTKPATRVHTNVPRAGYAGLPMGHEMFVYRWQAKTNIRIDEPLLDWASESVAQFVYNDKPYARPVIDLLMAPQAFWVDLPPDQRGNATTSGHMPIQLRENLSFHVQIQTASRALEQLQQFLITHTVGHRMIFWIYLDGIYRRGVQ